MHFQNPYWTPKSKIQMLQHWIIVHSIIYYRYDENIVSDYMYDKNCVQLVKLMQKHPESVEKSAYHYCFNDFNGSTGFHLYSRLTVKDVSKFETIAERLIKQFGRC